MDTREDTFDRGIGRHGGVLDADGGMAMQSTSDMQAPTRWLYASLVVLAAVALLTLFEGLVGTATG